MAQRPIWEKSWMREHCRPPKSWAKSWLVKRTSQATGHHGTEANFRQNVVVRWKQHNPGWSLSMAQGPIFVKAHHTRSGLVYGMVGSQAKRSARPMA